MPEEEQQHTQPFNPAPQGQPYNPPVQPEKPPEEISHINSHHKKDFFSQIPYLKEVFRELVLLLSLGPFIIGWIIGILEGKKNDPLFRLSVQNAMITMIYLTGTFLFYLINRWFFESEVIILWIYSLINLGFIGITIYHYGLFRFRNRVKLLPQSVSLLDALKSIPETITRN